MTGSPQDEACQNKVWASPNMSSKNMCMMCFLEPMAFKNYFSYTPNTDVMQRKITFALIWTPDSEENSHISHT